MRPAGDRNHLRREINAEDAQPQHGEVRRNWTGTTTHVHDRTGSVRLHEFSKGVESSTVLWSFSDFREFREFRANDLA